MQDWRDEFSVGFMLGIHSVKYCNASLEAPKTA